MVTTSLLHFPEGKRPSQQCKTAPPHLSREHRSGPSQGRTGWASPHRRCAASVGPSCPKIVPYKGDWYGTRVVEAGQWFPSSKTCSVCGVVNGDLDREPDWDYAECGAHHDRNENAARNLRKHALLAVGEEVMLPDEGRTKHDAK